ncbi:MAG: LuxR C-terminal-related transcriptional regulator, partial [Chloroflexota bacterium]|nr:LuxR C-terminal-related transcriptional regulator [Chloroflexota bacterium]
AVTWGQAVRAARLLGAVDALREMVGIAITMEPDRVPPGLVTAAAQAALGEAAFASAWAEGNALTLDEAIAEVGQIESPPDPTIAPAAATARYGLSPREVDVLRGIVSYLTDREIAERLSISRRTVEWHVTGILTKLGVDSRRAAASKATDESLL